MYDRDEYGRPTLNHIQRLKPETIPAWALLNRHRFGEANLCQFPDAECNAARVNGTGFCADHIETMRERACQEIRESIGICAMDEEVAA